MTTTKVGKGLSSLGNKEDLPINVKEDMAINVSIEKILEMKTSHEKNLILSK